MTRKKAVAAEVRPLSTDEAAARLGVAPSTLRSWRHRNEGPESYHMGGKVVYDEDKVEAYRAAEKAKTVRGGVR